MDKKELKKDIFLKKSKLRREVYNHLDKPKTATDLAKELGKHRSSISRILLDMERAELVKCINPEDKSFRMYLKR
jgi:DNA-binding IclR family transcriptional regulator